MDVKPCPMSRQVCDGYCRWDIDGECAVVVIAKGLMSPQAKAMIPIVDLKKQSLEEAYKVIEAVEKSEIKPKPKAPRGKTKKVRIHKKA